MAEARTRASPTDLAKLALDDGSDLPSGETDVIQLSIGQLVQASDGVVTTSAIPRSLDGPNQRDFHCGEYLDKPMIEPGARPFTVKNPVRATRRSGSV